MASTVGKRIIDAILVAYRVGVCPSANYISGLYPNAPQTVLYPHTAIRHEMISQCDRLIAQGSEREDIDDDDDALKLVLDVGANLGV